MQRTEPSRLVGLIRGLRSAGQTASSTVADPPGIESFTLIIGAMKAGTAGLYDALATHPAIAPCRVREPNFFGSDRWEVGRSWYESQWPDFDPARHAWALEASTQYTKHPRHPEVAERIAGFGARFRFLYMLCDPVARIERHIGHNIAMGHVRGTDYRKMFDQALAVSRYATQLERLRTALGTPEVLIVDGEDYDTDPDPILRRCAEFLGIDPDHAWPSPQPVESEPLFPLGTAERAELGAALRDDMLRLRDDWNVDVARWGFTDAGYAPRPAPEVAHAPASAAPSATSAPKQGSRGNYWARRQDMMYYDYIRALARPLAADARSLIDVGSHQTSVAEEFDWIPDRVALDLRPPYSSEAVRGIQADFLTFEPERRYDFALCLQVLEHVPEAEAFARKLLAVADRVLVSVPYNWPKGRCVHHCQDPVDEAKLADWFGRKPDYSLIVEEAFRDPAISRRIIAYFHKPGEKFDRERYRRQLGGRAEASAA